MRELSKFATDNSLPRYILYTICLVKLVTIYDKMKGIVALNTMKASIMRNQSKELQAYFKNEEELQDLITKRILEARDDYNDDPEDLEMRNKYDLHQQAMY